MLRRGIPLLILSQFLLVFSAVAAAGQSKTVSVLVYGGPNYFRKGSLAGSWAELIRQEESTTLPLKDIHYSYQIGGIFLFSPGTGAFSPYGGIMLGKSYADTTLLESDGVNNVMEMNMNMQTFSAGIEYPVGNRTDNWSGFLRGGLSVTALRIDLPSRSPDPVSERVTWSTYKRSKNMVGIETGAGGRYRISGLPFSLEASAYWSMLDLLGSFGSARHLRDLSGFSAFSLRFGAQYYF